MESAFFHTLSNPGDVTLELTEKHDHSYTLRISFLGVVEEALIPPEFIYSLGYRAGDSKFRLSSRDFPNIDFWKYRGGAPFKRVRSSKEKHDLEIWRGGCVSASSPECDKFLTKIRDNLGRLRKLIGVKAVLRQKPDPIGYKKLGKVVI